MSRYKLTVTDPEGKRAHYNSIAKLAEVLTMSDWILRHKLSKCVGKPVYIKGHKIKTEVDNPLPDGVWAIRDRKLYAAANFHAVGTLVGIQNGALRRRWELLGKPDSFPYAELVIGVGNYSGPPLSEPKPKRVVKPWRREPEYTEDRIAPRIGGLLTAGYTVHGLGIRR